MTEREKEIEEVIMIVGPLAARCGILIEDTERIIGYVDEMRDRGISGKQAGHALRVVLNNHCKKERDK